MSVCAYLAYGRFVFICAGGSAEDVCVFGCATAIYSCARAEIAYGIHFRAYACGQFVHAWDEGYLALRI